MFTPASTTIDTFAGAGGTGSGVPDTPLDAVTGPYDAIAYAEAPTPDDLGRLVVSELQKVPGIHKTLTCMVVDLKATKAA